ncbi:MAG: TauD/TfdA dioxygenase family protein [Aquincola tertiaricarbonis]
MASRDSPKSVSNVANQRWHSDSSFMNRAPPILMLHCVIRPSWGGDTEFADARPLRHAGQAHPRRGAVAARSTLRFTRGCCWGDEAYTDVQEKEIPPAVWPLVDTHPGSGRKLLLVRVHARQIVGWPTAESRMFLLDLREHVQGQQAGHGRRGSMPRHGSVHRDVGGLDQRAPSGDLALQEVGKLLRRAADGVDAE